MDPERAHFQAQNFSSRPSRTVIGVRKFASEALDVLMPNTIEVIGNGLSKAERLLDEKWGLVVLYNHFSKRDSLQVIKDVLFASPTMRKRPVFSPIAYHQFVDNKRLLDLVSCLTDVRLQTIVVQDTIDIQASNGLDKGEGLTQYIRKSADVLGNSGIVPLPLQPGRRQSLRETQERTVEFLVRSLTRREVTRVAFLLVGVGIQEKERYEKDVTAGYNFGRMYETKIGPVYTLEEAEMLSGKEGLTIDGWMTKQFEPLVPPQYR